MYGVAPETNMDDFELTHILDEVQPTSKDGKSLKAAFLTFLQEFPTKLLETVNSIREDNRVKDEKISNLEKTVDELSAKVLKLEEGLDDQEAYERRDTLIISGKNVPTVSPNENCPALVQKVVADNLNLSISSSDISVSHRLGPPPRTQQPDRRRIIVKFCRREDKINILQAARRVKPTEVFINESLTPQRQTIMMALRRAKRQLPNLVSGTSTIEGSVYVWVPPPNPTAPGARDLRLKINSFTRFEDFCLRTLKTPAAQFLQSS